MADYIVDPSGNITPVRPPTAKIEADAQPRSSKLNCDSDEGDTRRWNGREPLSKKAILGLIVAFVIELGAGVWLYREHEAITQAENAVVQRELSVLTREMNATESETANRAEAERLSAQEDSLEAQDARLAAIDSDLKSKSTELAEREHLLTKREEEDDEDDANQALALSFVQDTLDRIREAVHRQNTSGGVWSLGKQVSYPEPAMPPEAPAPHRGLTLDRQVELLEARYRRIEQSAPESESGIAGRRAALAELASECAELIARGSIDSLQIQAAIEVDLELLRDCAARLGLPEEVVPQNLYELLESSRLEELGPLQASKVAFLKERDTIFSGLYQGALAEAESTLQQIQDAKDKRPADPTLLFAKEILERRINPADAAALRSATTEEVRTAAIDLRHAQLLKQQMAIRWGDIGIRQRLQDTVVLLSPELREQFRNSDVALKYIDFLSASTPSDPGSLRLRLQNMIKFPATVGEAVKQFISKRYSDPIRAAELQAVLEEAYASENGEIATPEDRIAFKEWLAGHLSPGKAYELLTLRIDPLLGIFSDLAAINDLLAPHADDRNDVEETRRALLTENARRPGDISAGESRLNSSLRVDRPEPQRLYGILRILAERAGTSELTIAWNYLAFDGLSAQLDLIDTAKREAKNVISENGEAIATLKTFNAFEIPPSEIHDAELTVAKSYKAIELRLNELQIESPAEARVQELLTRVKEGYGPNPPPPTELEGVKAASDYGDAFIVSQIRTALPKELAAIASSTEKIVARSQEAQTMNSLGRRLAELSFRVYPEGLPHELVKGELPEHIKDRSKEERIKTWAGLFTQTMGKKEIESCIESLESTLLLRPQQMNQSKEFLVPVSILYDSIHGVGAFSKADPAIPTDAQRLRDVVKRVTYMGKDRVGREIFKVDGVLKAVNNHDDGSTMLCPVYIPQ